MSTLVKMPAILADATEATLSQWLVSKGDDVRVGQVIAEIETEKATVDFISEDSGTVARLLVEENASVEVGATIAVLASTSDTEEDLNQALSDDAVSTHSPSVAGSEPSLDRGHETGGSDASENGLTTTSHRLFASPLVRKLAKENSLDLMRVEGSGPGGRIIRSDVESLLNRPTVEAPDSSARRSAEVTAGSQSPLGSGHELRQPSPMRRAIARRLTESKTHVPHFYVSMDVGVDALFSLRKDINETLEEGGIKASVNDLLLCALGKTLAKFPIAQSAWTDSGIVQHATTNIAVAIATEGGLVTPVVRDVAGRSLSAVVRDMIDYKLRARSGKLKQHELEGGTFSLSNLGMYGVRDFAAIINPPQAGILAVGAAERRPVVQGDAIEVGTIMTCTLSADHRVLDGAQAGEILQEFKAVVENPVKLLI